MSVGIVAVPFDHTYILYDPSDLVSSVCVQFCLLPIYLMVFYTSWFLITREIEPVIIVGGHLCGEVINKILKRFFKQARPDFHRDFGNNSFGLGYGMPSAHSQFMGLFVAYYVSILLTKVPMERVGKAMWAAALAAMGFGVAFSRVYLLYHTVAQVTVGFTVGIFLGVAYYLIIVVARDVGFIDWILSWHLLRRLGIKDSYHHCYRSFQQELAQFENVKRLKGQ